MDATGPVASPIGSLCQAAIAPTTPDTATLQAVADHLDHVITHGEAEQAKALLAILIADLRIKPRGSPTHLPRRRTRGLRADKCLWTLAG
ncbi:MAG TPA: hypothetical protein VFY36_03985 [Solirubrobacteraceae bacterium]|nr:hypothetical protein [Solirubrobacteraceae bacterium]